MNNPKSRILIVEDEAVIAYGLRNALTKLEYTVVGLVAAGEDALPKVEETCPDLVLMDIKLTGKMTGLEAAAQIQAQFDIPVIYLTCYPEWAVLPEAETTEHYFLDKLASRRKLQTTIEMALRRHQLGTK